MVIFVTNWFPDRIPPLKRDYILMLSEFSSRRPLMSYWVDIFFCFVQIVQWNFKMKCLGPWAKPTNVQSNIIVQDCPGFFPGPVSAGKEVNKKINRFPCDRHPSWVPGLLPGHGPVSVQCWHPGQGRVCQSYSTSSAGCRFSWFWAQFFVSNSIAMATMEAMDTNCMTLTRFILAEQKKYAPSGTG